MHLLFSFVACIFLICLWAFVAQCCEIQSFLWCVRCITQEDKICKSEANHWRKITGALSQIWILLNNFPWHHQYNKIKFLSLMCNYLFCGWNCFHFFLLLPFPPVHCICSIAGSHLIGEQTVFSDSCMFSFTLCARLQLCWSRATILIRLLNILSSAWCEEDYSLVYFWANFNHKCKVIVDLLCTCFFLQCSYGYESTEQHTQAVFWEDRHLQLSGV